MRPGFSTKRVSQQTWHLTSAALMHPYQFLQQLLSLPDLILKNESSWIFFFCFVMLPLYQCFVCFKSTAVHMNCALPDFFKSKLSFCFFTERCSLIMGKETE